MNIYCIKLIYLPCERIAPCLANAGEWLTRRVCTRSMNEIHKLEYYTRNYIIILQPFIISSSIIIAVFDVKHCITSTQVEISPRPGRLCDTKGRKAIWRSRLPSWTRQTNWKRGYRPYRYSAVFTSNYMDMLSGISMFPHFMIMIY